MLRDAGRKGLLIFNPISFGAIMLFKHPCQCRRILGKCAVMGQGDPKKAREGTPT